jgi:lipoprotein-releasing system permease protein
MRYLRARRRERFVSLIALISLAGVALGTFVLTVTLAVMTGFQEDLRERLLSFSPHVTVETKNEGARDTQGLSRRIAAIPGVVAVAPFLSSQVMAVSQSSTGAPGYVSGGVLKGVVAGDGAALGELRKDLTAGGLEALTTTHEISLIQQGVRRRVALPGAIVGKSLAADLGLEIGDLVTIISPASLGGATAPRLRRFVVGGLFYSGMDEFDSSLIFVSLPDATALLSDDPLLETGLEVRVRDPLDAPKIAAQIAASAGQRLDVKNWTLMNAPLFSALELEKFTYFVVLMLIVLVAAFNIVATLVMVVMERRKEIAILRAMGARAASIVLIFLWEGIALGLIGTTAGVGAGFVASLLIGKYHLIHLPPDVFMVSAVPVRLYPVNFIAVAAAAIALCLLAAVYPGMRARSLSPVEVIRYE